MTRSGSIVYYLAAVVCGCLFMSLALLAVSEAPLRSAGGGYGDLFLLYFLSVVNGWFTALVFAFLLRRMTSLLRLRQGWLWILAGAAISPLVVWVLAESWPRIMRSIPLGWPGLMVALSSMFLGPVMALALPGNLGRAVLGAGMAGAATALVLYAIHRAFARPAETNS